MATLSALVLTGCQAEVCTKYGPELTYLHPVFIGNMIYMIPITDRECIESHMENQ